MILTNRITTVFRTLARSAKVYSKSCIALLLLASPLVLSQTPSMSESDYQIGAGDLLAINFWQKPEFNAEVRVSASGSIEIPLIGTLKVAGATPTQLRDTIEGRISLLDVKVTQVSVSVKEFGSKVVYVTGGVVTPGKYYFEVIPNIWQIILEAGGPLTTAQLDKVAVVHSGDQRKGQITYVNVAQALESGETSRFQQIYPGDTIHIPSLDPENQMAPVTSPLQQSGVVYIWGSIQKPGVYNVQDDMDVMEAIVLAGGPAEDADMKNVRLYFRGKNQAEVAIIDMNKYLHDAYPLPLLVHSGDSIYIPSAKKSLIASIAGVLSSLLYVAAGVLISRLV